MSSLCVQNNSNYTCLQTPTTVGSTFVIVLLLECQCTLNYTLFCLDLSNIWLVYLWDYRLNRVLIFSVSVASGLRKTVKIDYLNELRFVRRLSIDAYQTNGLRVKTRPNITITEHGHVIGQLGPQMLIFCSINGKQPITSSYSVIVMLCRVWTIEQARRYQWVGGA